jgi:hypothetical protein
MECGEASPLWVVLLEAMRRRMTSGLGTLVWTVEKPKRKTQSGDASPHSIENPK